MPRPRTFSTSGNAAEIYASSAIRDHFQMSSQPRSLQTSAADESVSSIPSSNAGFTEPSLRTGAMSHSQYILSHSESTAALTHSGLSA